MIPVFRAAMLQKTNDWAKERTWANTTNLRRYGGPLCLRWALGLSLLGSLWLALPMRGDPVVGGTSTTVYATVAGPQNLAFAPDGTLFVGRDSCGGGCLDTVKIWRVGRGGSPVSGFGNAPISDPDALIVDQDGRISGITGSVLIGGESPEYPTKVEGIISRIAPDESVAFVFGPDGNQVNPSDFAFDSSGRLLITDYRRSQVLWTTGGSPQPLFNLDRACYITIDSANRVVVSSGGDGYLRLYALNGSTIASPWFNAKIEAPLERGSGGFWGTDVLTVNSAGDLLRVDLTGSSTRIGSGFGSILYLRFGPDGALYASDPGNGRILRIAPAPSVTSVSPNPIIADAANNYQTLTVSGANFVNKPTVVLAWTGQPGYTLPASQVTFLSISQLTISVKLGAAADNWTVKVVNPDNQSSSAVGFTVNAPTYSISPNPASVSENE